MIREVVCSFLGSLCFAFVFNIKGSKLFFAGFGGLVSSLSFSLFSLIFVQEITQCFYATIITAIYAEALARIKKAPAVVFLVPSIIPLVPGGSTYYTMELCILGKVDEFIQKGLYTFGIAGSLAMGILVVSSLNRIFNVIIKRKNCAT